MATFHYCKRMLRKKGPDGSLVDVEYAKIDLAGSATEKDVAALMAERTGLSRGDVQSVMVNLGDVLTTLLQMERSVKIVGIGTFTPAIDTPPGEPLAVEKARIKVNFRLDKGLAEAVNRDRHIVERR